MPPRRAKKVGGPHLKFFEIEGARRLVTIERDAKSAGIVKGDIVRLRQLEAGEEATAAFVDRLRKAGAASVKVLPSPTNGAKVDSKEPVKRRSLREAVTLAIETVSTSDRDRLRTVCEEIAERERL